MRICADSFLRRLVHIIAPIWAAAMGARDDCAPYIGRWRVGVCVVRRLRVVAWRQRLPDVRGDLSVLEILPIVP